MAQDKPEKQRNEVVHIAGGVFCECGNSDYQKGQRRDIFCDKPPEVFIERPKAEAESRRDYADAEKEIYHFLLCVCETRFHTQLVV